MRKLVILLFGTFMVLPGAAQDPFFQVQALLGKNDDIAVNTIYQDRNGFIWFGTKTGLFRFDGSDRRHYTLKDGLPDACITAIAEDASGKLWLGCANGMIAWIENGAVNAFKSDEGDAAAEITSIPPVPPGLGEFEGHMGLLTPFLSLTLIKKR